MINLNDLRLFSKVIDHGGFSAASQALRIPKQTLSKRVAALEAAVGARLLQRSSRRFSVTALGDELHRRAAAMLIEAEAAEALLEGRLGEPSGLVRVTASTPVAQRYLAPLLPELGLAYPKIRLALHVTDRFVDVVQEGFDLALRSHLQPLPDSELVQRRLRTEAYGLFAAPSLSGRLRTGTPEGLENAPAVVAGLEVTEWRLAGPGGAEVSCPLQPAYVANEGLAMIAAAEAGLGVVSLPVSWCAEGVAADRLVQLLPDWRSGQITTTLLMPSRRGQLPSVRIVADAIARHFAKLPSDRC